MRLLKPFLMIAAIGFVAACEEPANGSDGFPSIGSAGGGDVSVADAALAPMLDSVTMNNGVLAYSYYADVVSDARVLAGADAHCGGAGQAVITLNKSSKGGRAYNTMLITCR